jgi:hypothetical protein
VSKGAKQYKTFEEFWPYYVREHSLLSTRLLHVIGTLGGLGLLAASIALGKPVLAAFAPLSGYGFAWFSHFVIEKNRPATFTYPLWSLRGDFVMLARTLTFRMGPELERAFKG